MVNYKLVVLGEGGVGKSGKAIQCSSRYYTVYVIATKPRSMYKLFVCTFGVFVVAIKGLSYFRAASVLFLGPLDLGIYVSCNYVYVNSELN